MQCMYKMYDFSWLLGKFDQIGNRSFGKCVHIPEDIVCKRRNYPNFLVDPLQLI